MQYGECEKRATVDNPISEEQQPAFDRLIGEAYKEARQYEDNIVNLTSVLFGINYGQTPDSSEEAPKSIEENLQMINYRVADLNHRFREIIEMLSERFGEIKLTR